MEFTKEFEDKVQMDMVSWNLKHPLDYLWRKHFDIPFGSRRHLESSSIDQLRWFKEQEFVDKLKDIFDKYTEDERKHMVIDKMGDIIRLDGRGEIVKMTQEEAQEVYDSIDVKDMSKWDDL